MSAQTEMYTGDAYLKLITYSIYHLGDKDGISRQAIKKYVASKLVNSNEEFINECIIMGVDNGILKQPKGPSGPIMLTKMFELGDDKSYTEEEGMYIQMITNIIHELNGKNGSTKKAINKKIFERIKYTDETHEMITRCIIKGLQNKILIQKGPYGNIMLNR